MCPHPSRSQSELKPNIDRDAYRCTNIVVWPKSAAKAMKHFDQVKAKYDSLVVETSKLSTAPTKTMLGEAYVTIAEGKILETLMGNDSTKQKKTRSRLSSPTWSASRRSTR